MSFTFKVGDTAKPLIIPLTEDGLQLSLTSALGVRIMGRHTLGATFIDANPSIDASAGTVTHYWLPGEVNLRGRWLIEVEVTWPGLGEQTFPEDDYLAVDIKEALV